MSGNRPGEPLSLSIKMMSLWGDIARGWASWWRAEVVETGGGGLVSATPSQEMKTSEAHKMLMSRTNIRDMAANIHESSNGNQALLEREMVRAD